MEYVLLMRGINVGGHRRVVMADLRGFLFSAGANDVQSHINSGNVLFGYEGNAAEMVAQVIKDHYEFEMTHTVIAAPDYLQEVSEAPEWWRVDDDNRYNALFKLPGYLSDYDQLIKQKLSAYDEVEFTAHVIFWRAPMKINYRKSFFSKLLSQPFYSTVSIRNRNTTLKLAKMVAERLKKR